MQLLLMAGSKAPYTLFLDSKTTNDLIILVNLAFLFGLCVFTALWFRSRSSTTSLRTVNTDSESMDDRYHIAGRPIVYSTDRRTVVGIYGCFVYGYPSTGGVIIRTNADLVELTQLGLDRLEPLEKRSDDQEAEDAFCDLLRKVGGKWWKCEQRYHDVSSGIWKYVNPTDEEKIVRFFGWPEEEETESQKEHGQGGSGGGVLMLEYEDVVDMPNDVGRLRMAVNMEERCRLMKERLSAKYYANPALCPPLADLHQ